MSTKPNHTDPTYLRTIHDGLLSGAVHKDNASSLPLGLVGLYEKELPPFRNVNERKKFLEFFSVWALLKKEVSVAFVLPMLEGWTEEQVMDYIAQYSKWFNSPVSGKFVLYHERLRTFILQKVAHHQFAKCNESVIAECQNSLQKKAGDEWEHYALEHLSTHLLIAAMENQNGSDLKALAYHSGHWNRQIEISKSFKWSKNLLNDMMLWASKYDEDEVIECALNKIDLYHLEQNDAPRIVELVAQNDLETALQRMESFGGNDKEGLQRKFILYMLCLMELTLLDSKNKPFRKAAIEKLLNHLDKQLPTDHSILKWNDFFPSYLMFLMACEWAELGLEYLITFKRTDDWEKAWIEEKRPYTNLQLEVLLESARSICDESDNSIALAKISTELCNLGKGEEAAIVMKDAISYAKGISIDFKKFSAFKEICSEHAKQGKFKEALIYARDISEDYEKSSALGAIATELGKQGQVKEAIACVRGIINPEIKSSVLLDISAEWGQKGGMEEVASFIQEAYSCALEISSDYFKCTSIALISSELWKKGQFEEASSAIQEALSCAHGIKGEKMALKCSAIAIISTELWKQGRIKAAASAMQEALIFACSISDGWDKSCVLKEICIEKVKQGHVQEAISCVGEISFYYVKSIALKEISIELVKQAQLNEAAFAMQEALSNAKKCISSDSSKSRALKGISDELVKQGQVEEAANAMKEVLPIALGISDDSKKCILLKKISVELGRNGRIEESLSIARGISDDYWKSFAIKDISTELGKQGSLEEALACVREISDESDKCFALGQISTELCKQGRMEESESVIKESLAFASSIRNEFDKDSAFKSISTELARQGQVEEAITCARDIIYPKVKSSAFGTISTELGKQGRMEAAESTMQEALTFAGEISDDLGFQSLAFRDICAELAKQGRKEESLAFARGINDDGLKINALTNLSTELVEQGFMQDAAYVMQEALACALGISSDYLKSFALNDICIELGKQGQWALAESTSLEIPQIEERHNCWKSLAQNRSEDIGGLNLIQQVMQFKNEEARFQFIKGWTESVSMLECSKELFLSTWFYYRDDMKSLEEILHKFALNQLFFEVTIPKTIQRLNHTLNIQWAIEIKNSFSAK